MELIGLLENVKTEKKHVSEEIEDEESCHICGTLLDKFSLESHYLTHKESKEVKCHICEKTFSQRDSLNSHLRFTHKEEKKNKCDLCTVP